MSGWVAKRGENEGSISIITLVFSFIGVTWEKKLTEDQRYELMVELYANELSMEEIMAEFGISKSFLYSINAGKKYPIEDYNYPIRRVHQKNEVTQHRLDKLIELNMEPPQTYTINLPELKWIF